MDVLGTPNLHGSHPFVTAGMIGLNSLTPSLLLMTPSPTRHTAHKADDPQSGERTRQVTDATGMEGGNLMHGYLKIHLLSNTNPDKIVEKTSSGPCLIQRSGRPGETPVPSLAPIVPSLFRATPSFHHWYLMLFSELN